MTAPDPRLGEIEARVAAYSQWPNVNPTSKADVAYILVELRKRDEALARVEGLADKWWANFPSKARAIHLAIADVTDQP